MNHTQKPRVTLDHPDLGGRARHNNTNAARSPVQQRSAGAPTNSVMVDRARRARQPQPTRVATPVVVATPVADRPVSKQVRVQAPVQPIPPAQPPAQYSEVPIEPERFSDRGFNSKTFKTNALYAMAALLFIVGMGVAVQGYLSNRKAKEQIAVLGEAVSNAQNGDVTGLASSLPNEDEVSDFDIANYKVAPDKPRYFRAPTIGVRTTRVLETGLTEDGAVETPAGIFDTSWYNASDEVIDEKGAMFVVGHYVGPTQAGIFWRLKDLNPGDEVEIEQGDGTVVKFRVVETIHYDVENVDMNKALKPVNPEKLGLNLMTCGGDWVAASQLYDERILVRTEKI